MSKNNTLKIGSAVFTIKMVDDPSIYDDISEDTNGSFYYGYCDNNNRVIYINNNLSKATTSSTILHEIIHAIWYQSGLSALELEEETVVSILTPWIELVFSDNKSFLDKLL